MSDSSKKNRYIIELVISMAIFGTIGIFRRGIDLPSGFLAMCRGYIGVLFLLCYMYIRKICPDFSAVRKNLLWLLVSGAAVGFNWILLFESYNYTTVATATLCYYFSPVFIMIFSPFVLHEKLSLKKALCIVFSLIGMVLVSGILQTGLTLTSEMKGILLGVSAAVLYASVTLMNKKIRNISSYDRTVVQLLTAAVVVTPYVLLRDNISVSSFTPNAVIILLALGIVHTGIAFTFYFGSVGFLPAQTSAVLGYIDPVVAVLLSALFLHEPITVFTGIGAVLILGASAVSEISFKKK